MNIVRFKNYILVFQLILLCACSPQATPSSIPSIPPESTESPVSAPIDLAGPQMIVGSTFLYADGSVLVPVPAGSFTMGNGGPDNPEHLVNLSEFWIYSTKVTNGQYAYCVYSGLCSPPYGPDNPAFDDPLHVNDPVVGVNYEQAAAYCSFVHARLPTEAEWEKTARGPESNIYPWGDGAPNCDLLNYGVCKGKTTPVTTYPTGQSYYHAFDMAGNALEWVADWYKADYYVNSPSDNPQGTENGRDRSVRSSAFNSGGDQIPAATRSHSWPDTHRDNLSFRCVVEDPTYFAPSCETPATYGTDGIGGATSGPQSVVDCPEFSITQNPMCIGTNPTTYVGFEGPFTNHSQPVTCTEENGSPDNFKCTDGGQLAICGTCSVTLNSEPLCPGGTSYDETLHTCVALVGGTGGCLPGFSLDSIHTTLGASNNGGLPSVPISTATADAASPAAPADQCCAYNPPALTKIIPGQICLANIHTPDNVTCHYPYPSCPVGTTFDGQECVSVQAQPFCKFEGIILNSCTTGGDGGGGGGPTPGCPVQSCGTNYIWNPTTCQCDCNGC